MTYKEAHEAFVSNHNGTSFTEIFLLSAALPSLCNAIYFALGNKLAIKSKWLDFATQFLVLAIPILVFFTCLADYSWVIGVTLLGLPVLYFTGHGGEHASSGVPETASSKPLTASITSLRAFVNIATAVAILAVDFTVFPRRYAKVETFGTGLMDTGVGQYVFSMALVSREARQQPGEGLMRGWKTLTALLVLGSGRLLTTKAAAYQEHTSEYGVHWNFFFTLAALKVFTLLISGLWHGAPSRPKSARFWSPLLTACAVGVGYHVFLERFGGAEFVQHSWAGDGARTDFISANREGILSSLGYITLYSASVQLARCLWCGWNKRQCLLLFMVLPALVLATLLHFEAVQPVSRRMANLGFVLWQLHQGTSLLLALFMVYCAFERTQGQVETADASADMQVQLVCPSPPPLLVAISQNQLVFFLAANLATGAVNFSMQTIFATELVALCVLVLYLAGLCMLVMTITSYQGKSKQHVQ